MISKHSVLKWLRDCKCICVVRILRRCLITAFFASFVSTLLFLHWAFTLYWTSSSSSPSVQVTYRPSDVTVAVNISLNIWAVDGFAELENGGSPLRIPLALEDAALGICRQQAFNGSRTISTDKVIVPSVMEYQCDVLERCNEEYQQLGDLGASNICPCLPETLVGKVHINKTELQNTSWVELLFLHKELSPGGHWKPPFCVPRRRVAVIIPYRDRQRHLRAFLVHIHPILQRQLVEYRIFVIEQNMPYRFNKASLMNIGYLEAVKVFNMDCVLFHDVDTLIERDDNMVVCGDKPIHFAAYADRHKYRLHVSLFGSAVLLTKEAFESANGFSNMYYGWGAEDDDFKGRLLKKKYKIYKGPTEIARCTLLKHKRDILFDTTNYRASSFVYRYASRKTYWYEVDGLNSVDYSVLKIREHPLFTWIHVDLKVPQISTDATKSNKLRVPSQMMRNVKAAFKQTPSQYVMKRGICSGYESSQRNPLFLSLVTCRYLCDSKANCIGIEYHDGNYTEDDYCYMISEPQTCFNISTGHNQIHLKHKV